VQEHSEKKQGLEVLRLCCCEAIVDKMVLSLRFVMGLSEANVAEIWYTDWPVVQISCFRAPATETLLDVDKSKLDPYSSNHAPYLLSRFVGQDEADYTQSSNLPESISTNSLARSKGSSSPR